MSRKAKESGTFVVRDKNTKQAIGIRWVFDMNIDGSQEIIFRTKEELGDELFLCLATSAREEAALVSRNKYHATISLDAAEYEGEWFADNDTPERAINIKEEQIRVDEFLNFLTDNQREKLEYKLDNPEASFRDIADHFGLALASVRDIFVGVRKKYEKFFGPNTTQKRVLSSVH